MHQHAIEMPEWVTGLIGIVLLVLSCTDSLRHHRRRSVREVG
jgi:hypothetical protein